MQNLISEKVKQASSSEMGYLIEKQQPICGNEYNDI